MQNKSVYLRTFSIAILSCTKEVKEVTKVQVVAEEEPRVVVVVAVDCLSFEVGTVGTG